MFSEIVKRNSAMHSSVHRDGALHNSGLMLPGRAGRRAHYSRRHGQAVLLATLVMFVVAAVGAGFILFVQGSMNLSQRSREESEALLLAQAGLAFADAQLTENGADWRPSIMVDFDEFERSMGWHRPDSDNDWYGKYAARQVVDLLGNVAGSGAFLIKVKYLPNEQTFKIISIGRPRPNSPVHRRIIGYKPTPAEWIWVTAQNEGSPDPLLVDADGNNIPEVLLGQDLNWQLAQNFWFNAERDPLQPIALPTTDPERLTWLRLRTWLGSARLPIWDQSVVFTSTIRINSDLLWYGVNALNMTSFFAASQTLLEVARTIRQGPGAQVLVYDWQDGFQGFAQPSDFGMPQGSGFLVFPIGGVPRYMDGWERVGGLLPVRWVFNFPRRTQPRVAPSINMDFYYALTRDVVPYGYYRIPESPSGPLVSPNPDPNGFYISDYSAEAPLSFRGIYIDNTSDRQFETQADAPDVDGDGTPDPGMFVDDNQSYRPELAQIYDWLVKPPQIDLNNPAQLHPRRQQPDSGWLQNGAVNVTSERNIVELTVLDANNQPQPLPFSHRAVAPNLYVPPGVEIRFDVVSTNNPTLVLQRTWLIRHDGQPFLAPNRTPLGNRLVFIDPVQLTQFDADGDGRFGEDPINFRDDDGDGKVDEDPPHTALQLLQQPQVRPPAEFAPQGPRLVIVAAGNIRVSGQVAVSLTLVTPETIYVEGPLHPVTSNATIELLAKRNVCINFAAARTPIPSLDGLDPMVDRALLLPQFRIVKIVNQQQQIQGMQYPLPNLPANFSPNPHLPLFADFLGGSISAVRFPSAQDTNKDQLVDLDLNSQTQVTFNLLVGQSSFLSDDLIGNFTKLQDGVWTLRLVLLHRGLAAAQDTNGNWQPVRNPWTNLAVDVWFDENGNGVWDANEPRTRLYGPAEPMRTFPVASRWYQGDGDLETVKEWGIWDIPIPPTIAGLLVDRDGDNQVTFNDLSLSLQRLCITVTSPVAGEVIPQGRTPVPYEVAGIKLALYDENGIPRPIWQLGEPWFVLAQTIHAENGTIGIVPPPYFDPTAHPSWQSLIVSNDPNWQQRFRQWQRLWSFYYLRYNSVRWSSFVNLQNLPFAQSVPILAGQLIIRVTPQTMLWRLADQLAAPFNNTNSIRSAWELALDKASIPYGNDLSTQDKIADLINLQRATAPVFVEVPRTMFASAWLWAWRAAPVQGVLNLGNGILPQYCRAPVVPNLSLPKGYSIVLQQQVGKD
ncbi:MAG: hypothetical protein ACUVRR_00720 [Candidatus Fervidibacter sp.]|uniref:hypothetical protein n=1 Tax=Candidatus Fervidibacter sp. TaxID=3100871 RepID=UPI00404941FD